MKIKINTAILGQSKWYEYLLRFLFGGAITAVTGLIAKRFGPGIGGLFLAFPAIFPATATLIEKHEKPKKERAGKPGIERARAAAGIDAVGAAMGALGLASFAAIVWRWLPDSSAGLVLAAATLGWLVISVSVWLLRDKVWRRARASIFRIADRPPRHGEYGMSVKMEPPARHDRRSDG